MTNAKSNVIGFAYDYFNVNVWSRLAIYFVGRMSSILA